MEVITDTELRTKHEEMEHFDIRITCSVPVPIPVSTYFTDVLYLSKIKSAEA